jgi:comEA protein
MAEPRTQTDAGLVAERVTDLATTRKRVEDILDEYLTERTKRAALMAPRYGELWQALSSTVQGGGKRIRPYLMILAYETYSNKRADECVTKASVALEDGQQVYIPRVGEEPPAPLALPAGGAQPTTGGSTTGDGAGASTGLVNINSAGIGELETLHGIGPALAQAIVDHRDRHGRFTSVDQLVDVRGIGEGKLEGLRDEVTV